MFKLSFILIEKKQIIKEEEKAVLVGVIQQEHTEEQVNEYLAELAFLAETAGAIAIKIFKQRSLTSMLCFRLAFISLAGQYFSSN